MPRRCDATKDFGRSLLFVPDFLTSLRSMLRVSTTDLSVLVDIL